MSIQEDEEHRVTRELFYKINGIAFGVPFVAFALIYSYVLFFDLSLEKKDWKSIVFVIWVLTLLVLLREGLSKYRDFRRNTKKKDKHKKYSDKRTKGNRVNAWEGKKTVLLGRDLLLAAVVLPLASGVLIYVYTYISGLVLERKDLKLIVFCIWIGVLLSLIRISVKARKGKISY